MRKSDGSYTYFLPDVAYHVTKWERGFHRAVNVQGSDHHGTIARVRAGLQALGLGIPPAYPDYVLHKMVTVMRGGQEVKISKRAGSYVTVRDLIEWSGGVRDGMSEDERDAALQRGRDAVRFFLVSRKADTEFVFDVDLALARSDENPVYYVQYAHARISSITRFAETEGVDLTGKINYRRLETEPELDLIRKLAEWPEILERAARQRALHPLTAYAQELAASFHYFYTKCRVVGEDKELSAARMSLSDATRIILKSVLSIIGVSAPERM